jgi:hypothetical protein
MSVWSNKKNYQNKKGKIYSLRPKKTVRLENLGHDSSCDK